MRYLSIAIVLLGLAVMGTLTLRAEPAHCAFCFSGQCDGDGDCGVGCECHGWTPQNKGKCRSKD